jgi:selenoprotein W-related protein
LAARILKEFGIEPELIKGDSGIFDVAADGKLIFSKYEVGRFPEEGEILELVASVGP